MLPGLALFHMQFHWRPAADWRAPSYGMARKFARLYLNSLSLERQTHELARSTVSAVPPAGQQFEAVSVSVNKHESGYSGFQFRLVHGSTLPFCAPYGAAKHRPLVNQRGRLGEGA